MAGFFLKILLEELIDEPSAHEMRLLLHEASMAHLRERRHPYSHLPTTILF
jgi:hypothetical protein